MHLHNSIAVALVTSSSSYSSTTSLTTTTREYYLYTFFSLSMYYVGTESGNNNVPPWVLSRHEYCVQDMRTQGIVFFVLLYVAYSARASGITYHKEYSGLYYSSYVLLVFDGRISLVLSVLVHTMKVMWVLESYQKNLNKLQIPNSPVTIILWR